MKLLPKLPAFSDVIGFHPMQRSDLPPESGFNKDNLGEKEVFLKWTAQSRPDKKGFDNRFMRTFIVIGIVLALLLVIMQEYFFILLVSSVIFVVYVLSKTTPETLDYEISSHGITIGSRLFYWNELAMFFFMKSGNLDVLCVDTRIGLPSRLFITILPENMELITQTLSKYIHFLPEEPKTILDKLYDSVMGKLNI